MNNSIFKTLLLSLCIVANTHLAYAQTASILPPAKTQYLDNSGKPLTSGKVFNYIPSTTTLKTTWQDAAETIPNTNPVILDAGGRAKILGDGSYRQIVKDRFDNIIWDAVTSSTGSGSSGTISTGDGDLVGTVKPWAGMTAPNQYAFTYGQELNRTTYASLFTAITYSQPVFCSSGSPTLTGLTDTTNFWVGMSLEATCLAAGNSTVLSKTATTLTMAANANVTTNITAVFFPWGRGNGSSTFNLPDFRGLTLSGNNNMGGVASTNSTIGWFGATDPNSAGAKGGQESYRLSLPNIPDITSSNASQNITVSTGNHFPVASSNWAGTTISTAGATNIPFTGGSVGSAQSLGPTANSISTTYTNAGGGAGTATVAVGGSGYTSGTQILTLVGGTCSIAPQYSVTVVAGAITAPVSVREGLCTVKPTNPVTTSGGGGTLGTLTVSWSQGSFSTVSPTRTVNYIIKTTPDTNSATASGVTSLGSMTGDIACGVGLTCTGNIISASAASGLGTIGGIPYYDTTTTTISSAQLAANQLVIGGGTGAPTTLGSLGTTSTVLHGNAAGAPTFGAVAGSDISSNTVANSNLTNMAAATIKMNPTAGSAAPTDSTIQGLTNLAVPSSTLDFIPIYDNATGTIKKATPGAIASAGVAGVSSFNSRTGVVSPAAGDYTVALGGTGVTNCLGQIAGLQALKLTGSVIAVNPGTWCNNTGTAAFNNTAVMTADLTTSAINFGVTPATGGQVSGALTASASSTDGTEVFLYLIHQNSDNKTALVGSSSDVQNASTTYTATAATPGVITCTGVPCNSAGHGLRKRMTVRVTTTGTAPAPLGTGIDYFVCTVPSITQITLATSIANVNSGSCLTFTTTGTGTNTLVWGVQQEVDNVLGAGIATFDRRLPYFSFVWSWSKYGSTGVPGGTNGIPDFQVAQGASDTIITNAGQNAVFQALSAGTATSFTAVDLAPWLSNLNRRALVFTYCIYPTTAGGCFMRATSSGGPGIQVGAPNTATIANTGMYSFQTDSTTKVDYMVTGGAQLTFYVMGWTAVDPS